MRNWKEISVDPNTKLSQAIEKINSNDIKFILVVNKLSILVNCFLNDGDIRRAVLKKLGLSLPIKKVMSKNPFKVINGTPRNEIISLMKKKKIFHLPIVDEKSKVVDVVTLNELLTMKKKEKYCCYNGRRRGKKIKAAY